MLKNNVKNALQRNFIFNPYSTRNIIIDKIDSPTKTVEDEEICKSNLIHIDIPNYLISPSFKNIEKPLLLCAFQIVFNESYPLLLYLLFNNEENELTFIRLNIGRNNNKQIKHEAVDYISKIIFSEISYAGFIETSENNIVFLKCCNRSNDGIISLPTNNYYWTTPHELINLKTVINLPINENTTQFFMDNPFLLILRNKDDRIYSTPVIGYYKHNNIQYLKKDDYTHVDIFSEKINDALGNYYSFYLTMPSKSSNELIMRVALFLIKPSLNNTLNKADSIIFNKYKDRIRYAIKNYNQHIPLSYH